MEKQSLIKDKYIAILIGILILYGLYLTSLYSYLLFHSIAEIFSIVIACGIFMVAWNARKILDNKYLLFIGIAYLFVSLLDVVHTLAYKGMNIFRGYDANLPTQLWIIMRSVQSISLLIAPLFLRRKLNHNFVFVMYWVVTAFLLGSIFYWKIFPDCFVEGKGLTEFKKISEYIISLILLLSLLLLLKYRKEFDKDIHRLLLWSIILSILSELTFTFYLSVYDIINLMGHYLEIIAFFLIYKAIIVTAYTNPYSILFRNLKQSEEALRESDTRYRTLFNSASDGIFVCDFNGRFLDVNEVICEELMYKCEELLGMNYMDVIVPENAPPVYQRIRELSRQGQTSFETVYLTKDGTIIPIEVNSRIIDYRGTKAILSIARNITERKKAESELTLLSTGINQAYDSVVITDINGNIEYVNPAFEQVTGYSREEFIGKNPRILKSGKHSNEFYQVMWNTILKGDVWYGEITNKKKDGAIYNEETIINPVKNRNNEITNFVAIKRDITRKKELEEKINRLQREYEAFMRHELKNMLSPIKGYIYVLSNIDNEGLNEEQKEIIDRMKENLDTVVDLIDYLKKLQDFETGHYELNKKVYDLKVVIDWVISDMELLANKSNVKIELNTNLTNPNIELDINLLKGVFSNLIKNAIEHISDLKNESEKVVKINMVNENGKIIVKINNKGEPIPSERLKLFFEKFNSDRLKKKDGTGLGTTYAYLVTKAHGGDISVESDEISGTTVILAFNTSEVKNVVDTYDDL